MNINNAGIYDAAYNGFIGGATEYRSTTSTSPAAYTTLQSEAAEFAALVDAGIPSQTIAQPQSDLMTVIVAGVLAGADTTQAASNATLADIVIAVYTPMVSGLSATTVVAQVIYGATHTNTAPVFDGVNTYSYATLAGSTYTLNEDLFTNDGATVEAGITLNTNSFKLYCNGTFTNNGTISNNGANASGATAGTHTYTSGTLGIGLAGGNGHTGSGTGTSASPQGSTNTVADALMSGGAGGAGGVEAGGAGGVYLASTTNGGSHSLVSLETGYLFAQQAAGTGASLGIIGGGCGGGGGGSDNAGVNGGGGGGGGGVMVLCLFDFVNNGVVEALGGNGAAASGAGGNGGGGGGGAGGFINILARYRSGNGTVNVSGGAGGAAIGASGVAGVAGNHGHINPFWA